MAKNGSGLVMRFACTSIERHSVSVLPAHGPVQHNEERRTVRLKAISAKSGQHPNRKVWGGGIAAGELVLAELLPDLVDAQLELHREYVLELRPLDDETTKRDLPPHR